MSISLSELAKKLEIAPEAVILHSMDLDFEMPEDEIIPNDIAVAIEKLETTDELAQLDHEYEEQMDRDIIETQQAKTAGSQKKNHKKKEEPKPKVIEIIKDKEGSILLPENLTVRELAIKIEKPIPIVLINLKKNGIIANLQQEIDYETAAIVAEELGIKVKKEQAELSGEDLFRGSLEDFLKDEEPEDLVERPPIISIMGHVDHGKTSILDYIRKTSVADKEAGGITQKIGAYQIKKDGKFITFLDTPGHEAFTTMRARGARATDIAVLVVAATEGLKPQSIEAINHAKEAEIPIIVAINKMDLDGANPELVKGGLAEQKLTPEDWGGETPCIEVSAKTGAGIDKLIETIQITAELQELKANPTRRAIGTVLEAVMDKRSGISATVLINTGTIKKGDAFVIYNQHGKIRSMKNYLGEEIKTASPSTPIQISGFSTLPQSGDLLQVMDSEKIARKKAEEVASLEHEEDLSSRKKFSLATIKAKIAEGKLNQLKLIIKADSKGSLEAVTSECEKLKTDKSMVKVVHAGVGEINESDVMLSSSGEAIVIGFGIKTPGRILKLAKKEGVDILDFDVIYHLTEKIQEVLEGRDEAKEIEEIVGTFQVKKIFASNKKMAVLGGEALSGVIRKLCHFRLFRSITNKETNETEEQLLGQGKIETVQRGSDIVNSISEIGLECGMKVSHKDLTFEEKDRIELFVPKKQ
ncbi:translation initiation factor IF-2 [Candidatus Gracilibacteria bacterium]|nr:translation initiation factor IF-2 [Candidatus Gracilibacteria bacterium]